MGSGSPVPLRTVVHEKGYIHDARLTADGDSLWTIDSGGRLYLWNAHTGEKQHEASVRLPSDRDGVFELRSVDFVAGGRVLLCAYHNRKAFGDDWKRGLRKAPRLSLDGACRRSVWIGCSRLIRTG